MPAFDADALKAPYAGQGEDVSGLAESLATIHGLTCNAMDGVERRLKVIQDLEKTMQGFGMGLSIAREPATVEAIGEISRQDVDIQKMGSSAVSKCIGAIDFVLQRDGVEAGERLRIMGRAFELCIAPLPERVQPQWREFSEQIELRLAASSLEPASSVASPRL